jgi:Mg-chelatase subunit ChlD
MAAETGPRYKFRRELRNPEKPMQRREYPTKQRKLALGILVDCSGSMGGAMDEVRKAVLGTYFAADAIRVPMAVWGFSDWSRPAAAPVVPFGMSSTLAPEFIAGLDAVGGTALRDAFDEAAEAIKKQPADRHVLMVIHDGQPSDMARSVEAIKREKRNLEVIGIFLGDGRMNADLIAPMRELFADKLISANDADELMVILGGFLVKVLRPTQV